MRRWVLDAVACCTDVGGMTVVMQAKCGRGVAGAFPTYHVLTTFATSHAQPPRAQTTPATRRAGRSIRVHGTTSSG